jgi:hypothetical protein
MQSQVGHLDLGQANTILDANRSHLHSDKKRALAKETRNKYSSF